MVSQTWQFEPQNLPNHASESAITGLSWSAMCNVGSSLLFLLHWFFWFYWRSLGLLLWLSNSYFCPVWAECSRRLCEHEYKVPMLSHPKKLRLHGFWIFTQIVFFSFCWVYQKTYFCKCWNNHILTLFNISLIWVLSINLSQLILVESTLVQENISLLSLEFQ